MWEYKPGLIQKKNEVIVGMRRFLDKFTTNNYFVTEVSQLRKFVS